MTSTGQTADGTWEIGVRRTAPLEPHAAWQWLRGLLDADAAVGNIRSETPGEVVRASYQPAGWTTSSILQLRVIPAASGTTLAVHHERLPDGGAREAMRQHWTNVLDRLVEDATETPDVVEIEQFHTGVADWRVLNDGACAYFRTGSFAAGARLVEAIAALEVERADVDLRQGGVTVRLITSRPDFYGLSLRDLDLARRISMIARELDIPADPGVVQAIQVSIDAADIPAARSFWRAALGYRDRPDTTEDLVDPDGRGVAVWFQPMDAPRPLRNRIHLDLKSAYDVADARREVALAAGGRLVDAERPWVFVDPEGNEICLPAADAVPREPDQREGWDPALAEGRTEPVGVGWQQFHETDGVEDWRMLDVGVGACFRTGSFARGAQFVGAICALDGLGNRRPAIDVRRKAVTVRLITITDNFGGPASQFDVVLARQISAIAAELGIVADPAPMQSMLISIDALDIPAVMRFWVAVLAFEYRPDTDHDLLDPHDRWPTFWFQQMDAPREQRNRIHIDVSVPYDQAESRIAAALKAGGRVVSDDNPHWTVLADPEGNEVCVTAYR